MAIKVTAHARKGGITLIGWRDNEALARGGLTWNGETFQAHDLFSQGDPAVLLALLRAAKLIIQSQEVAKTLDISLDIDNPDSPRLLKLYMKLFGAPTTVTYRIPLCQDY